MKRFAYEVYIHDSKVGSCVMLDEVVDLINAHAGFPLVSRHIVGGWYRSTKRGHGNKARRYAHIRLEKQPLTRAVLTEGAVPTEGAGSI